MNIKPHKWTDDHTHRIYHLLMGVCFTFLALAISAGTLSGWLSAKADTITDSASTDVTASVPSITPGPIGPGSGGGCCPGVLPPTGPQSITIVPEPEGQIPQKQFLRNGQRVSLYTFPTHYPAFSGHTTLNNAFIYITIDGVSPFYSGVRADNSGNWWWLSPVALDDSVSSIRVVATDPNYSTFTATAQLDFAVSVLPSPRPPANPPANRTPRTPKTPRAPGVPKTPGTPAPASPPSHVILPPAPPSSSPASPHNNAGGHLAIFLQVPESYKTINAGEIVLADIRLVNTDANHYSLPQDIVYTIEDSDHNVLLQSADTVTLDKSLSFSKTFIINSGVDPGQYTIVGKIENKTSVAEASDTFNIRKLFHVVPPALAPPYMIDWLQLLGILILLLFAFIAAIAYHRAHLIGLILRQKREQESEIRTK